MQSQASVRAFLLTILAASELNVQSVSQLNINSFCLKVQTEGHDVRWREREQENRRAKKEV